MNDPYVKEVTMPTAHAVRACLITNPRSGRGGIDLAPILPILEAHGWEVTVREKLHGGHATVLAREAIDAGVDVVIAGGGDGTLGEVVDAVVGSDVAVGILPGGTANLWAHELGVSKDLAKATLQLVGSQRRRIDAGHVAINGKMGRTFLLMAGLGFDAVVLSNLNKRMKKRVGKWAYLPAIGRALPKATPFTVDVDLDGVAWQGEVVQIVVGNTRRYASVTSVTPKAYVDDGLLDVSLLTPTNPVASARQLATLLFSKHPYAGSALMDRVGHLTVRAPAVIPLETDGGRVKQDDVDVGDDGVVYEFSVRAQALTVLVPRAYSGDLFRPGPAQIAIQPSEPSKKARSKRRFRVIAVGIDTITAARERDGLVLTVRVTPETVAVDANGNELSLATFLDSLSEGQILRVRGERLQPRTEIIAHWLKA